MKKTLTVLLFITLCNSCKVLDSDKTYTVKGKIVKDCGGEPIVGLQVRLQYYLVNIFDSKQEEIDIDTTDAEGNYEFTVPIKYYKDLRMLRGSGNTQEDIIGGVSMNPADRKEGGVYEYLIYYDEYTLSSVSKFIINNTNYSLSDTLYIGTSSVNYRAINPIGDTALVLYNNSVEGPNQISVNTTDMYKHKKEGGIFWGIGWVDYDKALRSPGKESYHRFYFSSYVCVPPDTNYFSIP